MESESVHAIEESKPRRQKKLGKIARVYELHQKGVSVKEIAEKMKLSERILRSYIWRVANPEKYKVLVQRYFTKRKRKQEKREDQLAVKKQKKAKQEEESQ